MHTVSGPFSRSQLGHCQIHEHVWLRRTPMAPHNPALCMEVPDASLAELRSYAGAGGTSLVDAQPLGAGRDAETLHQLSIESGVAILACTGYHLLGYYPGDSWLLRLGERELTEEFCMELEEGMLPWEPGSRRPKTRTPYRAGLVKAAIPAEGPVGRYAVLLRAAARAAAASGAPLMLHTEHGSHAMAAVRLCLFCGLEPGRIIICHADRQTADLALHQEIARQGVFLDYDTIGRFQYHSDEEEIRLLQAMEPFSGQILLSLDTTAARLLAYGGQIGLAYLRGTFRGKLLDAGFSPEQIRRYNHDNCSRLFFGS